MDENFTIGIIGGRGRMGKIFREFFENKGYKVLISYRNSELSNKELTRRSKLVLISVSMENFHEVVKEIAGEVTNNHWIMDICSLKSEPVRIMKKYLSRGEILATHPLFGPCSIEELKGKTIVYWNVRGKNLLKWFLKTFSDGGLNLIKISPQKHDKLMGLIQVINHFWLILLGNLIKNSQLDLKDIVSLSTPSFLKQLEALKKFSFQDPKLYEKIQLENPWGNKFRNLFYKKCKELKDILKNKNREDFYKYFEVAKSIADELNTLLV